MTSPTPEQAARAMQRDDERRRRAFAALDPSVRIEVATALLAQLALLVGTVRTP